MGFKAHNTWKDEDGILMLTAGCSVAGTSLPPPSFSLLSQEQGDLPTARTQPLRGIRETSFFLG